MKLGRTNCCNMPVIGKGRSHLPISDADLSPGRVRHCLATANVGGSVSQMDGFKLLARHLVRVSQSNLSEVNKPQLGSLRSRAVRRFVFYKLSFTKSGDKPGMVQ